MHLTKSHLKKIILKEIQDLVTEQEERWSKVKPIIARAGRSASDEEAIWPGLKEFKQNFNMLVNQWNYLTKRHPKFAWQFLTSHAKRSPQYKKILEKFKGPQDENFIIYAWNKFAPDQHSLAAPQYFKEPKKNYAIHKLAIQNPADYYSRAIYAYMVGGIGKLSPKYITNDVILNVQNKSKIPYKHFVQKLLPQLLARYERDNSWKAIWSQQKYDPNVQSEF